MTSITCISLLFLSLAASTHLTNAVTCSNTGNFTANSTYARNRDILLSSFSSNVVPNHGFFNTTVGQGNDQVYGLAFCAPQHTPEACLDKVTGAIQELKDSCPYEKEALAFANETFVVRYANRNFFGMKEESPSETFYNTGRINYGMEQFGQIWDTLMKRVVSKASEGNSTFKYATGEEDFSFETIYSQMMCIPYLSESNCRECLRTTVSRYKTCCWGYRGGAVRTPSCLFRWDMYSFYTPIAGSTATAPPPTTAPPPPPITTGVSPPTSPTLAKKSTRINSRTIVIIVVVPIAVAVGFCLLSFAFFYRKNLNLEVKKNPERKSQDTESLQFSFANIKLATDNFSENNKLGQGGFGIVYKGVLPAGQIIAVKRLFQNSRQGENEFKNEVLLLSRQQHRNLASLLGFCIEGNERLLIYEFLPNSSLDRFIFDAVKRKLMHWKMRRSIILGIARGILYLHEESQLRIIHRDLKASNILLDQNMNAKISDFGTAKLVGIDRTQETTSKIVGTFGYMAPEYAWHGHVSVKSDVFSFGVLVLEIITGEKISSFSGDEGCESLLNFVWENWNKETTFKIVDPTIRRANFEADIVRIINIGLLCVQENVTDRPTMGSVILMFGSNSITLQKPSKPAYNQHSTTRQVTTSIDQNNSGVAVPGEFQNNPVDISKNEASISELEPR